MPWCEMSMGWVRSYRATDTNLKRCVAIKVLPEALASDAERLAGFQREDTSETLAAILRGELDWTSLPRETPAAIYRLLRRAIAKDVRKRIADAASLRLEIDDALNREETAAQPHSSSGARQRGGLDRCWSRNRRACARCGLARAATLPTDPPELHVEIATPDTRELTSMAISPDGQKVAYTSDADGQTQLMLRDLSTGAERTLQSTTSAVLPFWSPNSRSIGCFASGRLKRIDIVGVPLSWELAARVAER